MNSCVPQTLRIGADTGIDLLDSLEAQSGGGIAGQVAGTKAPAVFKTKFVGQLGEHLRGVAEVIARFEGLRVVGNSGGIFDVVNIVSKPPQPDDVMNVLPDGRRRSGIEPMKPITTIFLRFIE